MLRRRSEVGEKLRLADRVASDPRASLLVVVLVVLVLVVVVVGVDIGDSRRLAEQRTDVARLYGPHVGQERARVTVTVESDHAEPLVVLLDDQQQGARLVSAP